MKSITLSSGYEYKAYWGGEFREARTFNNGLSVGDSCRIRLYHDLELITIDGLQWIKSYQDDPVFKGSYHLDYKSVCGNYKIAEYYDGRIENKVFYPFKCSQWRKDMQSTFGNYLNGREKQTFKTFKEAAQCVALYDREKRQ